MKQKEGESSDAYIKRLCAAGDKAIKNIEKVKKDMKRDGVIGFCSECGGNRYAHKKHTCI